MANETAYDPDSMEARAEREIGHTDVSRGTAWSLVLGFLVILGVVPIFEVKGYLSIAALLPTPGAVAAVRSPRDVLDILPDVAEIEQVEADLEDNSVLREVLLPPVQRLLLRAGVGNERVYPGRGSWLFFADDVAYVTGRGFLDPRSLEARSRQGDETRAPPQPDPRVALLDFHRQLAERGIELLVVPTPTKPMIYPERMTSRIGAEDPIDNISYSSFRADLREAGLRVVDVGEVIFQAKEDADRPLYLATDTHWTPEGMELAARELAGEIASLLGEPEEGRLEEAAVRVEGRGDIARMLETGEAHPPETVTVRSVLRGGKPWIADPSSEVLLLGDSFANIYSLPEMEWGSHGGLAERVSFHLGRSVDRIVRNDDGAFATRQELSRELASGRDRLGGKKVVVYQFAARELLLGDWKILPMDLGERVTPGAEAEVLSLEGTIAAIAPLPRPGSVPYKDLITSMRVESSSRGSATVVFFWGMRDHRPTAAARRRVGDRVTLRLAPWSTVVDRYGSFNRSELDDELSLSLSTYWELVDDEDPGMEEPSIVPEVATEKASEPIGDVTTAEGIDPRPLREILREKIAEMEAAGSSVLRGREGWLFFLPELRHYCAGPFWGDRAVEVGRATKPEARDPLPAILDLQGQLSGAGIELLLVPVPTKVGMCGENVPGASPARVAEARRERSSELEAFFAPLRDAGVQVLDLASRLEGPEFYCRQDTHWSPLACETVGAEIARRLADRPWFQTVSRRAFATEDRSIPIDGDLRRQIQGQSPERETLPLKVVFAEGDERKRPVAPWRESPVLLMGDSHTLVFREGGDLLASGAGLFDHLTAAMGFPPDLVGVRGSGSTAARLNVFRRRDNLKGKRVLIWCFSMREFTESSDGWRKVPLIR